MKIDLSEDCDKHERNNVMGSVDKNRPSLSSLIIWNVSKALEKNPHTDIRRAMKLANERMEHRSHDVNDLISQEPEERHIACAVLAWQQLGHTDTESLYEFIESHRNKILRNTSENLPRTENIYFVNSSNPSKRPKGFIDHKPSVDRNSLESTSFDTYSLIGPVLKLPVETKFVMRAENTSTCVRHGAKKAPKEEIKNKVDAACCLDSACIARLKEMERSTAELRSRATRLARREAERAELLERAEAAWRDLELGYQRRLLLAEEKEEDISKQIKKSIEDRNAYKHACTVLAQQLSKRGEIVENDRMQLTEVEKQVCDLACTRLRLNEEVARGDAAIADQQCKNVQLERDLQFKEEQARRKLLSIDSAMDSSRGLTLEAERAMREELGLIKNQVAQISSQLLEENAENSRIKLELDELRQQKTNMFEDLESCKQMCDNRMQGIADELNKKRQILKEMKEKSIDCQCKLPLDVSVEVKRTPSLAALCRCTAEEHILNSCSCTSIRTTLLSNLLSDLFGGLQAELGDTGSLMPCQLLKCLEDKHNWDRASIVKNNLRNFFSQLLVGELDTAIATSIEKYHATWIGVSCADKARVTPDPFDVEEGWQERVLEKRAQKLAGKLAEQLFQEKADQLVSRAKEIVASGPPPCECRPQTNKATAYPCLVKTLPIGSSGKKIETAYPPYLKRTLQDVSLLRTQIEDLKKETIKKEDLRMMEEKITRIVQRASGPDSKKNIQKNTSADGQKLKQKSIHKSMNTENLKEVNENRSSFVKKKNINLNPVNKNNRKMAEMNGRLLDNKLTEKTIKKMEQSYAVNLCLFDHKNKPDSRSLSMTYPVELNSWHEKLPQSILAQIPSIKCSRPIDKILSKDNHMFKNRNKPKKSCLSRCTCFHKTPSNTSINKLLQTLLKWKGDLLNNSLFNVNGIPSALSKSKYDNFQEIHHDSEFSNNKKSVNINTAQEAKAQKSTSHVNNVIATGTISSPPLTASEYIGEINLDKSNEHICKCNKEKGEKQNNIMKSDNLLFKCINKCKCSCEKSNVIEKFRPCNSNEVSIPSKGKDLNVIALTDIKTLYGENDDSDKKLLDAEVFNNSNAKILYHKNNQTTVNNCHSSDRDFSVKFLGVTLTDVKGKAERHPIGEKKGVKNNYKPSTLERKQEDFCSTVKSYAESGQTKPFSNIKCDDKNKECLTNTNRCEFVEIYTNLDNNITECGDNINESKNDQSLSEMLYDTKSCVCCNYDDETKNLEVNTFTLLQKHLKHKLAEFRKSDNSNGIMPDEEEKVFITILDKVKQVISHCAYNLKCECSVENNNSGSWIRFNDLLEEYLKIKIKRVQCSCLPNKESLETILPGVLEKVSKLIENDFERLKRLCKHENSSGLECGKKCDSAIITNKDSQSLQPHDQCIDIENVSIQASHNIEIEDKSCDVIQFKDTKDIQTSQNKLLMESHSVEVFISHCCDLHNDMTFNTCASKKETEINTQIVCEEPLYATEINSSKSSEKNQEPNKVISHCSLRVPYVGYTLSSSCDNLNSCVCSKTMSHTSVNNIHNIWKMLEINKRLLPNLSYIMHSIPKTVRSQNNIVNFVELTDTSNIPLIQEQQSVKNISACDGEEIMLKDSDEKLKNGVINDNTTNTMDDLVSVKTACLNDDDALYWYDCCPSPRNVKNEMTQKKAFYDSIYSPIGKLPKHGNSDTSVKNNVTMCSSKSKNCDCVMVPVCHVKMLVENIESKIVNSQCICDSLSPQVCPLHSKTFY